MHSPHACPGARAALYTAPQPCPGTPWRLGAAANPSRGAAVRFTFSYARPKMAKSLAHGCHLGALLRLRAWL